MLSPELGAVSTFGRAGADQLALNIGQAAEYREHQAPDAGAGVGPRLGQGSELRFASTMRLTIMNRPKVLRASRSIRVTGGTEAVAGIASQQRAPRLEAWA
jgi:hypothetical protein